MCAPENKSLRLTSKPPFQEPMGKNSKNKLKSSRMEENVTRRTKIIRFKQKNNTEKIH